MELTENLKENDMLQTLFTKYTATEVYSFLTQVVEQYKVNNKTDKFTTVIGRRRSARTANQITTLTAKTSITISHSRMKRRWKSKMKSENNYNVSLKQVILIIN